MRAGFKWIGVIGLLALLGLAFSASAAADLSFCSLGTAAGQCEKPEGVAVDRSNGNVYVVDRGNNRVEVFDSGGNFIRTFGWGVADGTTNALQVCTASCHKGIAGSGSGQFLIGEGTIAVDNDPASPSFHDVYVAERDNRRVQKFTPTGEFILMFGKGVNKTTSGNLCTAASGNTCGAGSQGSGNGELNHRIQVAVGPAGAVYVADTAVFGAFESARVQMFNTAGEFVKQLLRLEEKSQANSLAVDSSGDFYVGIEGIPVPAVRKYAPVGGNPPQLATIPVTNLTALAVDASDNLFAAERDNGLRVIARYNPSGATTLRFGYGAIEENLAGIAVNHTASGDVYGTETFQHKVRYLSQPPAGPFACCVEVAPGNTKATVKAGINPEGKASTYHFEYSTTTDFSNCGLPANPNCQKTAESASIGSDFTLHNVSATIGCTEPQKPPQPSCLVPETKYHFRVVASNADGKAEPEGPEFETKKPVEIVETWSTEVGTDAAQLHAGVNPLGIPATGYFEYVDDASFKASGFANATKVPAVPGQSPLDFGSGEAEKVLGVQLSSLLPGTVYHYRAVAEDFYVKELGEAEILTTFPAPQAPGNECENSASRSGPSANLPDCRAYEMVSPVDKNGGDIAVLANTFNFPAGLAQSSADGGRLAYSAATPFADAVSAPYSSEYIARREAGVEWSTQAIAPTRESTNLTDNAAVKFDVEYKAFSADLGSGWLLHTTDPVLDSCAESGFLNLYRRGEDGSYEALTTAKPAAPQTANAYWPELQGFSADGTHAVFRANGKLTGNASSAGEGGSGPPISQLYEHVATGKGCGQLRLVSVLPGAGGSASAQASSLGTRNAPFGEGRENTVAQAVSADGSRIFWSVATGVTGVGPGALYVRIDGEETVQISADPGGQFWTAATDGSKAIYTIGNIAGGKGELYEFDLGTKSSTLIAKGAVGVAEANESLSRLYFASTEALAAGAEAGKPNLYLREAGSPLRLVTTLAAGDIDSFAKFGFSVASLKPNKRGTRTSMDGSRLAFVSRAPITGYDNKDAVDGTADLELYLYDAGTNKVSCISCDPSGARPAGRKFKNGSAELRVAAMMAPSENQLYAPANLSKDGSRLFFESFGGLVPRDGNGKGDVYEWERAASQKECEDVGAELFVASAGGCLSLISSGQSPSDSEFVDASASGSDAFFKTDSSLLPQDPGLVDIYDARVNGGLPTPPPTSVPCEGEACQSPAAAPEDSTPSSSVARPGNVPAQGGSSRCPKKGKHRVARAGKKARCVAKHKRHHRKVGRHGRAGR